ncbi:MAG: hypothetical protein JSW07_17640 [bacterium]|nr:MAG: hypothetical protein JSW07_17640 [bacterium]
MATIEDVGRVKTYHVKTLTKKLNVNGVAVGHKIVAGKDTGELCVKVFVKKKMAKSELLSKDLVPLTIDGVPTDVKEVGEIVAFKLRTEQWRPAPGGVSIGHYAISAGTLGGFVKDNTTEETLILSNNHVMANSNSASIGDPILQPGPADGGRNPQDRIADLERFVIIQFTGGPGNGCFLAKTASGVLNVFAKILGSKSRIVPTRIDAEINEVDAAVAKPISDDVITGDILDIGVVTGTKAAEIGMRVRKSGRTTGTTTGIIQELSATVDVGYGGSRVARFENQIIVEGINGPFSRPGDSGSLVVDDEDLENPKAVGLLFAGSDSITVVNPIDRVLDLLSVQF